MPDLTGKDYVALPRVVWVAKPQEERERPRVGEKPWPMMILLSLRDLNKRIELSGLPRVCASSPWQCEDCERLRASEHENPAANLLGSPDNLLSGWRSHKR